jgi:hypothetical protein
LLSSQLGLEEKYREIYTFLVLNSKVEAIANMWGLCTQVEQIFAVLWRLIDMPMINEVFDCNWLAKNAGQLMMALDGRLVGGLENLVEVFREIFEVLREIRRKTGNLEKQEVPREASNDFTERQTDEIRERS